LCGPYFAFFILVWVYGRHYLNLRILLSEFYEFKSVGPYELNWETGEYKCDLSHYISTALLGSLQALNLFWLFYIFRIAYRFVFHNALEDDRSDDDETELAEEAEVERLKQQGIDGVAAPKLLVNGNPLGGKKATGIELKTDALTNRKQFAS
jgi:acyl-CoA-dependent ceramide synthase